MQKARTVGEVLFVQHGRETFGNCQELKGYIKAAACGFPTPSACTPTSTAMMRPQARQTGYGSVKEYEDLLKAAQKAASSKASTFNLGSARSLEEGSTLQQHRGNDAQSDAG